MPKYEIVVASPQSVDRKEPEQDEEAKRKDWWKSFWIGVGLGAFIGW